MFSMTACSLGQSIEVLDQDKIVLLQTEDMVSGEDIAVVETSECGSSQAKHQRR